MKMLPPQAICVNNLQVLKLQRNIMDHGKCIATSKQKQANGFFSVSLTGIITKMKKNKSHKLKSNFRISVFTKCSSNARENREG